MTKQDLTRGLKLSEAIDESKLKLSRIIKTLSELSEVTDKDMELLLADNITTYKLHIPLNDYVMMLENIKLKLINELRDLETEFNNL